MKYGQNIHLSSRERNVQNIEHFTRFWYDDEIGKWHKDQSCRSDPEPATTCGHYVQVLQAVYVRVQPQEKTFAEIFYLRTTFFVLIVVSLLTVSK